MAPLLFSVAVDLFSYPEALMPQKNNQEVPPFPLARVTLIFIACVIGFHLIQWLVIPIDFFYPLQRVTAEVVTFLFNLFGIQAVCSGLMVDIPNARWEVALECTSLSALIVFLSFIIAYPTKLKSKIIGSLVGLPLLIIANILRLVLLGWATVHLPKIANYLHDYVWQIGFLLLVALLWVLWIDLVVKYETTTYLPD